MTLHVAAVYERGVLTPKNPLPLSEGTPVDLVVVPSEPDSPRRSPAKILAAIASMPMETRGIPFSGREHDRILYGEKRPCDFA